MLELVDIGRRPLGAYRGIVPDHLLDAVESAARRLRGVRVLHLNATPYGGGVSELLRSEVPLLNDLGIVAHWRIIAGDPAFFRVTKAIHNGLQGGRVPLTADDTGRFLATSEANSRSFAEEYDFIFVHDPQPSAMLSLRGKGTARWIWRCHIDTSNPNPEVWRYIRPFLRDYDAAVFTLPQFVPPDFPLRRVEIIPPAIDPLSPKNMPLPKATAARVLDWLGIRTDRPLVTQVSRFDPWKDPEGVIAAYRRVREEVPELQLALVGSLALDDPEGWEIYHRLIEVVGGDRNIHLLTNVVGVGNIEVNAFQRLSRVVIQKSVREGFGLVVSEALWKGTPVVAGRAGGIPLQMADGTGGALVEGVDECAEAVLRLLRQPEEARRLAEAGRERVAEHFLVPRLLLNHLTLMEELLRQTPLARPPDWMARRDPVCGMSLGGKGDVSDEFEGMRVSFCSARCRALFREAPRHYLGSAGVGEPASDR